MVAATMIVVDPVAKVEEVVVALVPASSAMKRVTLPVTALMTRVATPTNDLAEKMTTVATPEPSQVVTTLDGVTLITATQTGIRTWVPLVAGVRSELDQASLAWTED